MARYFRIVAPDLPGWLATMPRPHGHDDMLALRADGVRHLACMLEGDELHELELTALPDWCAAAGIVFHHLPVPDRGFPADEVAALQLANRLAQAVRAGEPVVAHCRGGIGRATLMAALVMRVLGWSADDALDQIRHARGCPVPDTDAQRRWVCNLPIAAAPADWARETFNRLFDAGDDI